MSDELWTICGWLGIATIVGVACVILYCIYDALREVIRSWRWLYKYKHRFDKPPTAKCYCKDCKWHSVKDNKCSNVTWADRHTPDKGFCYEAQPMTWKEAARHDKAD